MARNRDVHKTNEHDRLLCVGIVIATLVVVGAPDDDGENESLEKEDGHREALSQRRCPHDSGALGGW